MSEQSSMPPEELPKLNKRHQLWLDEYFLCGLNQTEAARRAEYSQPHVAGSRIAKRADVKAHIKARLKESAMSSEEVLYRLTRHASGSIGDVLEWREGDEPVISLNAARDAGVLDLVKKVKVVTVHKGEDGTEVLKTTVELYDAQAALDKLGKVHGLFKQKVEHSGDVGLKHQGLIGIAEVNLDDLSDEDLNTLEQAARVLAGSVEDPG